MKRQENLIREAISRGFKKGVSYKMDGRKYTIKGDLFLRNMYKIGMGTGQDAFDYHVINHKNGNGYIYDGRCNKWAEIIKPMRMKSPAVMKARIIKAIKKADITSYCWADDILAMVTDKYAKGYLFAKLFDLGKDVEYIVTEKFRKSFLKYCEYNIWGK